MNRFAWLLALCLIGCSIQNDYAKISNNQACGISDCGKDPGEK